MEVQVDFINFEKIDRAFSEGNLALCLTAIRELLYTDNQFKENYQTLIAVVEWHEEKARHLKEKVDKGYEKKETTEGREENKKNFQDQINNFRNELGKLITKLKKDKSLILFPIVEEKPQDIELESKFKIKEVKMKNRYIYLKEIISEFSKNWSANIASEAKSQDDLLGQWSIKLINNYTEGQNVEIHMKIDQATNSIIFYYYEDNGGTEYFLNILTDWWEKQLSKVRLFISYSNQDLNWKIDLIKQFYSMVKSDMVEIFEDGKMEPGQAWEPELLNRMKLSDIILFLVSPDLLASKYIDTKELPYAEELYNEKTSLVFPIFIRWISVEGTFLGRIQGFPNSKYGYRFLDDAPKRDKALHDVVQDIREFIYTIFPQKNYGKI